VTLSSASGTRFWRLHVHVAVSRGDSHRGELAVALCNGNCELCVYERTALTVAPRRPGIPPEQPSRARVFNYWLDGYAYTEADRAEADRIEQINPYARQMMQNNGLFMARSVGWAVGEVGQILYMGAGFPIPENAHEIAQAVRPSAAVAYVDYDPEVIDSYDVLFDGKWPDGVAVICADIRDPEAIFGDPRLQAVIDLDAPVCLLFPLVLNTMPPARARDLVAEYTQLIAPGSLIVISCPQFANPAMWERLENARPPLGYGYARNDFEALFEGLELVPPGIRPAVNLRPGWASVPEKPPAPAYILGGVGRKPRQ
jgi:hypothetical protein